MKITWFGHACWRVEDGGYSVVLDPFAPGSVPGCPDVDTCADKVLCSHEHGDHNYKDGVKIVPSGAYPFDIKTLPTWHDEKQGTLRGYNLVHVLDAGFMRIVHLGDLGHELSPEQLKEIGTPDIIMIPVGGYYTIDTATAKRVADSLGAKVILPMHYRGKGFGYDVIGTVKEFTDLYPEDMIKCYDTNSIEIDDDTQPQVAVLKF